LLGTVWHADTAPHNNQQHNPTECFHINITLARLSCKLPLMMVVDQNV